MVERRAPVGALSRRWPQRARGCAAQLRIVVEHLELSNATSTLRKQPVMPTSTHGGWELLPQASSVGPCGLMSLADVASRQPPGRRLRALPRTRLTAHGTSPFQPPAAAVALGFGS